MKKYILPCLISTTLFSSSLSIEESYSKALNYEPSIKSYFYQTLVKKEGITQSQAALHPQLDLQINGVVRNYKTNVRESKRREEYYQAMLSSRLALYQPENYNAIDQARLKLKHSQLALNEIKQTLAVDVVDAYMAILRAKNALVVAKSYEEANKIRYEQIDKMYKKRLANKMDLFESKVTYERSKVKVNTEKHNLFLANFKFKNLLGVEKFEIKDVDFEKVDINLMQESFAKADLENLNFQLRKTQVKIDLADKQVQKTLYGHYPKVDLTASYSKYDTSTIYSDYKDEARVMLSFKLPLYQGGYTKSKVAESRYMRSAVDKDYKVVQKEISIKYEEMLIGLQNSKESIFLYKEAINSSKIYLETIEKGYARGLKNLIDLEDAKAKLYETKFNLIDSVYNYIKSYVGLLSLSGKLEQHRVANLDTILFTK